MQKYRPMLAPSKIPTEEDVRFPLLASRKLDGQRCIVTPDEAYSRTGKPLPNRRLPEWLEPIHEYCGLLGCILDGELYSEEATFSELMSSLRSFEKELPGDLAFYVFDQVTLTRWASPYFTFEQRLKHIEPCSSFVALTQKKVTCWDEIRALFDMEIMAGGEGLILRDPEGIYKHGRCTFLEHNMFKMKATHTYDAKIIGFKPLNVIATDERTETPLGYAQPIHRQDMKVNLELMGSLTVQMENGITLSVGSGFTDELRASIWNSRPMLLDSWIEFKATTCGVKDRPRFPVFVRFRDAKE